MKTLLKALCLFISLNASCQVTQTLPLHTLDYPNGAYLKDMNDELSFLEGTWEGISNNVKYTFEFKFFPQVLIDYENGQYEYWDMLKGKFKATNQTTNQVLYDNLSATSIEEYRILELYISQGVEFIFRFEDTLANCNNEVHFSLIKNINIPDQIVYKNFEFGEYGYFHDDEYGCPNYQSQSDIPMFLPMQELTLVRQ